MELTKAMSDTIEPATDERVKLTEMEILNVALDETKSRNLRWIAIDIMVRRARTEGWRQGVDGAREDEIKHGWLGCMKKMTEAPNENDS